jgi:hypothetical protein
MSRGTWQYKVMDLSTMGFSSPLKPDMQASFNVLGERGWEFVQVVSHDSRTVAIFKRWQSPEQSA